MLEYYLTYSSRNELGVFQACWSLPPEAMDDSNKRPANGSQSRTDLGGSEGAPQTPSLV